MKKGDYVKIVKISDDVFNGNHPNYINTGYEQIGEVQKDITIGERFNVIGKNDYLSTSIVTAIIDDETFKTMNSTYKVFKIYENENN